MKIYLKVIGCSCYTCLPRTAQAAAPTAPKTAAPPTAPKTAAPGTGTGTGAPQMDQRLLTNTWPKQSTTISIHAITNKS